MTNYSKMTISQTLNVLKVIFVVIFFVSSTGKRAHFTNVCLKFLIFPAAKLAAAQGISTRPGVDGSLEGQGKPDTQVKANGEVRESAAAEDADKHKKEDEIKRKKEEEEKAKENKVQDKSRPVSSTPVPGTPWYRNNSSLLACILFTLVNYSTRCVVWTGDGRVFFYNPSSRTSVWERPEDLIGRTDVDKMVSTPPDALSVQSKDKTPIKRKTASEDSDSESEDSTPIKKPKKEENNGMMICTFSRVL